MDKDKQLISIEGEQALVRMGVQMELIEKLLSSREMLTLESFDRLYKLLCDPQNIEKAVSLAYEARLKDAYCDPFEMNDFDKELYVIRITESLKSLSLNVNPCYYYCIPKPPDQVRPLFHIPFFDYCFRYLLALTIYQCNQNLFSKNIFGNNHEVFDINNIGDYKPNVNSFIDYQLSNLKSGKFEYMISLDITSYFHSVNIDILMETICGLMNTSKNSYFIKLLSKHLNFQYFQNNEVSPNDLFIKNNECGLVVGALIDSYFSNLYLSKLDSFLSNIQEIEYGRMTDDIKIFVKDKNMGYQVIDMVEIELSKLGLKLNLKKTKWVNQHDSYEEIQEHFLLTSSSGGYLKRKIEKKDNDGNVSYIYDSKGISEIIENNLIYDYIHTLDRQIVTMEMYKLKNHFLNLTFLITTFFKSQKSAASIINTYLDLACRYNIGDQEDADSADDSFYVFGGERIRNHILGLLRNTKVHYYYKYLLIKKVYLDIYTVHFFVMVKPNPIFSGDLFDILLEFASSDLYILSNTSKFIIQKYHTPNYWKKRIDDLRIDDDNKDLIDLNLEHYNFILNKG